MVLWKQDTPTTLVELLFLMEQIADGSSDAGDKALFELQTRSDILNNSSYSVHGIPRFSSGLVTMDSSLDMSIV